MMKKYSFIFALLLMPLVASADAVEIDGIYYNLVKKTKTAEVTSNPNKYTGEITIPSTVDYEDITYDITSIGNDAFKGNKDLTSITIPSSVTRIGSEAFSNCKSLTSITIPNGVVTIEVSAFAGSNLTSVTIPNSVTSIGRSAFSLCRSLTSISLPNSITSIENGTFNECSSLTDIIIPSTITEINVNAFWKCSSLTTITIPNSVNAIRGGAFRDCSKLASVTIGSGIKTVGPLAFASCPELTDVYCLAENVPNTEVDAFKDSYIEAVKLHVPTGSVDAYRDTAPWSNFESIEPIGEIAQEKCATPTISYADGKLKYECATEGAECVTNITSNDFKKHYGNEVELTAAYTISVYATKSGFDDSDEVTATLCWIDIEPKTGYLTTGVNEVKALPLLIQSANGVITVKGGDDGMKVEVYGTNGVLTGTARSYNGTATVSTTQLTGSAAIVKIGEKSLKVVVK